MPWLQEFVFGCKTRPRVLKFESQTGGPRYKMTTIEETKEDAPEKREEKVDRMFRNGNPKSGHEMYICV